ncbi:hypothetical protein SARC_00517 [Sphaeroforma arctica JP610]|uniref:Chromatin-remodeling ATPase INO80 n=1 Tax=Sphaeroforma arctica JP610 TaxID=667725 RepID=A0A0L0GES5_9EUKA|nr:hypothetical protein SARC_00517 [Sphaeroforma arctica JP610]KNC87376.1 hypothetical protein SARC_00517 [Sphaeroforma arctica JP610]|eukprot:XP_014161278.1 hypothetical protein SARC_00517 [Sphaeroforma arctica JP610]
MGLGKTVQTIALMSYLADYHQIWGPFMIVAPLSTVHNWQQELVKFNPSLKVLPYWGNLAQRKIIRKQWTHKQVHNKDATFHVLITSYNMVVSDAVYFNRLKWQYMVLDEAQAIKSSSSMRWKILLDMNCRNRLLLTGTPIQNSMAELWALLHFIMPSLFDSHDEFNEWFSKDIENASQTQGGKLDQTQLKRLHMILKPFMLRRLKRDVQHELGEKIEIEIDCTLTARQRRLYAGLKQKVNIEDLLLASSEASASRSTTEQMSKHLMNLVMQFRKVCNHPNLFERRNMESSYRFRRVPNLPYTHDETKTTVGRRHFELDSETSDNNNPIDFALPRLLFEDPVSIATTGVSEKETFILKHFDVRTPRNINTSAPLAALRCLTGLSAAELSHDLQGGLVQKALFSIQDTRARGQPVVTFGDSDAQTRLSGRACGWRVYTPQETLMWLKSGAPVSRDIALGELQVGSGFDLSKVSSRAIERRSWPYAQFNRILPQSIAAPLYPDVNSQRYRNMLQRQCSPSTPWQAQVLYGNTGVSLHSLAQPAHHARTHTYTPPHAHTHTPGLPPTYHTYTSEATQSLSLDDPYTYAPVAASCEVEIAANGLLGVSRPSCGWDYVLAPDKSAIILESDKMKALDRLLVELRANDHRVLIYSQMTKMIDILEEYMQLKRIKYMRLDGSSKVEDRRDMVADFQTNTDTFCFLLSTRAGGLGINLTAADTVIFYDSDWNPTVDQQAMDRAHRVGQTRQVTVYRLVTKGTIEERILARAKQKSSIQNMVISGGKAAENKVINTAEPMSNEVMGLLIEDKALEEKWRRKNEAKKVAEKQAKERERQRKKQKRLDDQIARREAAATLRKLNREQRAASKQTTRKRKPKATTPGGTTPKAPVGKDDVSANEKGAEPSDSEKGPITTTPTVAIDPPTESNAKIMAPTSTDVMEVD